MGVLRALLLRALLSQETQSILCFPKGYKPKPCPEVPKILICPSSSHVNRSPTSRMCTCGFQKHHPLTAALSFRISGARSSISVRWSRKICAVLHWIMVESREAHILRVTSPYRKTEVCDSAFPVPVQFQASPRNLCLVRQVPVAPSALLRSSLV